jgi:hypothetical protein
MVATVTSEPNRLQHEHEQSTSNFKTTACMIKYESLLPSLPMDSIREVADDDSNCSVSVAEIYFKPTYGNATTMVSIRIGDCALL